MASRTVELPREEWEVLIRDHHDGYITFEQYLANEAKLTANRTNAGARPPREGTALCQGIVFCGACGRSMQVRYQDRHPRYECSHSRADHVATPHEVAGFDETGLRVAGKLHWRALRPHR
ncbi:zinc ribbon domain-containing protein [Amycolatopsis sp.]|uniref:zinc ribbon domain-containing protein n=1 Tax=Amycolatopsis sp. TaxID=37632 RepID=UPI0039C870A4